LYFLQNNFAGFQKIMLLFDNNIGHKYKWISPTPISVVLYQEAFNIWPTDKTKAIYLLQKAIDYTPDWSHLRIELANAYQKNHQPQLAGKTISDCLSRMVPRLHCQQYIDSHQLGDFGIFFNEITKTPLSDWVYNKAL
jgi:hypothetical protein